MTGGRLAAAFPSSVFDSSIMEQQYVLIHRDECERLLSSLQRSIGYCTKAKSSYDPEITLHSEPTETYPGASGYACSTMKQVVCSLEMHMRASK